MVNNGNSLNTDIMLGTAVLDFLIASTLADVTLVKINK